MPYPKAMEISLMDAIRPHGNPQLEINIGDIFGIIGAARTIILNWTLKLEEDGILGEGLTFSSVYRQKATNSQVSNVTNFFGNVGQSQIQQHSPNASQFTVSEDIVMADEGYISQVKALLLKVKDAIDKAGLTQFQVDEAKS